MRLLAISGSLRAASSNTTLLRAAARLMPAGVVVQPYENLGGLPHFNPDLEEVENVALPGPVLELRALVGAADGLLLSVPEYARGVPGSFKNALDWLVGSREFPGKPVALLQASTRAIASPAALTLILETMSARLVAAAGVTVPLVSRETSVEAILTNPQLAIPLRQALTAFIADIRNQSASVV